MLAIEYITKEKLRKMNAAESHEVVCMCVCVCVCVTERVIIRLYLCMFVCVYVTSHLPLA
jgi:hypothetical protein